MNLAGVAFDMDGVLLDSSAIHRAAYDEALKPYGLDIDYAAVAGMRTSDVMRGLGDSLLLSAEQIDDLTRSKQALAVTRFADLDSLPLFPGAIDVVQTLSGRYPLALCTSASRATMTMFLAGSGLARHFTVTLCGDDVAQAKPSPEIYAEASLRLACDPSSLLVVEDALSGIVAAREAGCRVVHVDVTGACHRVCHADWCVTGIDAVPPLISGRPRP